MHWMQLLLAYLKFAFSVHPTVVFVNSSVMILGLACNSTTSVVFLLMEVLILNRLLMLNDIVEGTSQADAWNC